MQIIKKNLFNIFLAIYFIIGSFASLNTGISFDEYHEEKNWKFHVKLTKNLTNHFFSNEELNIDFNKEYKINYLGYGIGFQIVSQPIQSFVSKIMSNNNVMNDYGNHLTSKHFVVFLFFFLSGIFLYLILIKIVDDKIFCSSGEHEPLTIQWRSRRSPLAVDCGRRGAAVCRLFVCPSSASAGRNER